MAAPESRRQVTRGLSAPARQRLLLCSCVPPMNVFVERQELILHIRFYCVHVTHSDALLARSAARCAGQAGSVVDQEGFQAPHNNPSSSLRLDGPSNCNTEPSVSSVRSLQKHHTHAVLPRLPHFLPHQDSTRRLKSYIEKGLCFKLYISINI